MMAIMVYVALVLVLGYAFFALLAVGARLWIGDE